MPFISPFSRTYDASPAVPASSHTSNPRRRPSRFVEVIRKHPRNLIYALILCGISTGMAVGLAVSLNGRNTGDGYRGGPAINAFFVLAMIMVTLLAVRQLLFIYRLFFPAIAPHKPPVLPIWLIGRPPTYAEALDHQLPQRQRASGPFPSSFGHGRGTGDVEDRTIAQNESLPKYGENGDSTLLARGATSANMGGELDRDVGVIPSFLSTQNGIAAPSGGGTGVHLYEMSQINQAEGARNLLGSTTSADGRENRPGAIEVGAR